MQKCVDPDLIHLLNFSFKRGHRLHEIYAHNVLMMSNTVEPRHEISNNVVCATSKASDQTAHMRSPIRAFAHRF